MILFFIVAFVLIYNISTYFVRVSQRKKYLNDNLLPNDESILYDQIDKKICFRVMLVSGITVVLCGVYFLGFRAIGSTTLFLPQLIISGAIAILSLVIFIYFVRSFIICAVYLNGIKDNGYILPFDKAEYDYRIYSLLLEGTATLEMGEAERDKASIMEAVFCLWVFLGCIAYNFYFTKHYYYYLDDGVTCAYIMCVIDLFWLILAFFNYLYSDNKKYKNIKQNAPGRKNRKSVSYFVICTVIFLFFTFGVKDVFSLLNEFMYKSRCAIDAELTDKILSNFKTQVNNGVEIPVDVYDELKEGVDITLWENDCEFKDNILNNLGADSFASIADQYRNSYDVPEIFVTYNSGEFSVNVTNIYTYEEYRN